VEPGSKVFFAHREVPLAHEIGGISAVFGLGQARAGVEAVDSDVDAERLSDMPCGSLEGDEAIAAGNTEFES